MKLLIKNMVPNQRMTTFFTLEALELRESRNKKPYLLLTLSDRTGFIRGYLWKNPVKAASFLKQGMIVVVNGKPKMMNGFQIINVDRVRAAKKWEISRSDFALYGQMELFDEVQAASGTEKTDLNSGGSEAAGNNRREEAA
ncbi:MAG: OB-fold nucleic acid binding domain-containing protein [Nitrospiraceae bacterium]|nr:OB-fold nucleic acid binding domain-containing protein [Nitrospiraceae bacterium]